MSAKQVGITIIVIIALLVLVTDLCTNLYLFIKSAIMGRDVNRYARHLVLHVLIWVLALINIIIGG